MLFRHQETEEARRNNKIKMRIEDGTRRTGIATRVCMQGHLHSHTTNGQILFSQMVRIFSDGTWKKGETWAGTGWVILDNNGNMIAQQVKLTKASGALQSEGLSFLKRGQ